ncbi:MAG TPA: CRISPR-associated protein Cas4 [Candidatus Limnocylindrales bacterium]|nr:CRISPR-associated protein Cas4 [Candidatus Limnocylindrales bacterium]
MYGEDDLLPLSGLQHFTYCERRWALIHLESQWEENSFTAEGRVLHERVHSAEVESRPSVLTRRTLPLRSYRLGLAGQADIVEFLPVNEAALGVRLEERRGFWQPQPVEYKRRKGRAGATAYAVQLCAQGLCLEEMLGVPVPQGMIYDGTTRRRTAVALTRELRATVETAAMRMHELFRTRKTPAPEFRPACEKCSLREVCQPEALHERHSVDQYLRRALAANRTEGDEE